MICTEYGICIVVKEEHPMKAPYPISVTVGGMDMDWRDVQHRNAYRPILVSPGDGLGRIVDV